MFRSMMTLFISAIAVLALFSASSVVEGTPLPFRLAKRGNIITNKTDTQHLTARDFNCNVENISCCQQLLSNNEATQSLGGLLNVPISALGNVGLSCSPLLVSAISQCKSTPVCCSQVSESGAVNAGCSPLSVV